MTNKTPNELLEKIADAFADLGGRTAELLYQAAELEAAGMAHATENWKDEEQTVLRLIHQIDSPHRQAGGKRIEHIGKDPANIAEARARIQRWDEWLEIQAELQEIKEKHRDATASLKMIIYNIKAIQKPLPGFNQD